MEDGMRDLIHAKLKQFGFEGDVKISFDTTKPFFMTVIQHVLKNGFDLVVKETQALKDKNAKGFKSLDMNLLRKCPCPVWLCRPSQDDKPVKILTAVDPLSEEEAAQDLNIKLLQIGESLASVLGGSNTVISCWDFEYEDFLRNSPFSKMEGSKVDAMIDQAEQSHKASVKQLTNKIDGAGADISCERGQADDLIPMHVDSEDIDIVVMGTVARTGIPGFMIGNTAENIVQNLSCGMVAVKPNGFVSPIKAY